MINPVPRRTENDDAPRILLVFTCLVCTGVMMNVTVVIPTATLYGSTLLSSAFVISTYSLGAMLGLTLFRNVGQKSSVRNAYLLHCLFMTLGNFSYWFFTAVTNSYAGVILSRFVVGLEGGVMYNSNVALIHFSGPHKRVRYLSLYQFFVGFGLLCGPALSSISTLVGEAFHVRDPHALANLVMSVWGVGLAVALFLRMPRTNDELQNLVVMENVSSGNHDESECDADISNDYVLVSDVLGGEIGTEEGENLAVGTDTEDRTEERGREDLVVIWKIAAGNCLRITERIMWETGSILVMSQEFGWSLVTAGFVVGGLGGAQTAAQLLYAWLNLGDVHAAIFVLELTELAGIFLLFELGGGAQPDSWLSEPAVAQSVFLLGSIVAYCSNCLMSAPFNAVLLGQATARVDQSHLLLSSQYGIFFGFLCGPLIVRSVMMATDQNRNVLASVLLFGWSSQIVLNVFVETGRPTAWLGSALGFLLVGTLTWAVFQKDVGGTGADNIFSWHPVLMGLAWFGFANAGQHVYSKGSKDGLLRSFPKERQRRCHAGLMAAVALSSAGGYATVFMAHARNGESQFGFGQTPCRLAHALLGYASLGWMAMQAVSGPVKAFRLEVKGERSLTWHGKAGRWSILFAFVVATLGFWLPMNFGPKGGWGAPIKISLTSLSSVIFGIVYLKFHAAPGAVVPVISAP